MIIALLFQLLSRSLLLSDRNYYIIKKKIAQSWQGRIKRRGHVTTIYRIINGRGVLVKIDKNLLHVHALHTLD